MRVTNQIMTNNTLANINTNKNNLMKIEERYNTGKKIQRPSDDPVVAIRALKLRNNLTEITQYFKKNVPDARSWMQVTESALVQVTDICTSLHTLANQGAHDTLTAENRKSIAKTMSQYREQIYVEGNASYAGRFVFTGFKTDTSLTYPSDARDKEYMIKQNFNPYDIKTETKTVGSFQVDDYKNGGDIDFNVQPKNETVHTIRLAYGKLDKKTEGYPKLTYVDKDGETHEIELSGEGVNAAGEDETLTSSGYSAYKKPESGANFIYDTGEIVLSEELYKELRSAKSINIEYKKSEFSKGDVRPEHYFDCTAAPKDADGNVTEDEEKIIHYKKEDQRIHYDVSFNQRLQINTQAKDSISHEIGREIDGILSAVEDVEFTEDKIAQVDKLIKGLGDAEENKEEVEKLTKLKEQFSTELTLKKKVMQERFSKSLDNIRGFQDKINKVVSDLGSREVRLNLTETRLSSQKDDFTELMSNNEDADFVESIIEFNSQQAIYNASLAAASKVIQNTLLDFLK